jgi:transcriptional regulator of arginine metabolism
MEKVDLKNLIKKVILNYKPTSQSDICTILVREKLVDIDKINQSKVSRVLKQVGAVKVKDPLHGGLVYVIPKEPPPPTKDVMLSDLVIKISRNTNLIVIHTSPGAAPLIARRLDFISDEIGILGTISGDDTIFVAPICVSRIKTISCDILNSL